jgi:hypothetical protein
MPRVVSSKDNPDSLEINDPILRPRLIIAINEALQKVVPFGEVHLIVERGRIRFIEIVRSESVDKPIEYPKIKS